MPVKKKVIDIEQHRHKIERKNYRESQMSLSKLKDVIAKELRCNIEGAGLDDIRERYGVYVNEDSNGHYIASGYTEVQYCSLRGRKLRSMSIIVEQSPLSQYWINRFPSLKRKEDGSK